MKRKAKDIDLQNERERKANKKAKANAAKIEKKRPFSTPCMYFKKGKCKKGGECNNYI